MRRQHPKRSLTDADLLAADLAAEMLATIAICFEQASDEERADMIVKYASILPMLVRTVNAAGQAAGGIEYK